MKRMMNCWTNNLLNLAIQQFSILLHSPTLELIFFFYFLAPVAPEIGFEDMKRLALVSGSHLLANLLSEPILDLEDYQTAIKKEIRKCRAVWF